MKASDLIRTSFGRKVIREKVGAKPFVKIILIDGDSFPSLKGESFHYKTNGGKKISNPSAYSKKGWSNMNYIASSIRIEVGKNWEGYLDDKIYNSSSYLKEFLLSIEFYWLYNPSTNTYSIHATENIDDSYENLNLKQFKKIASKIIKNRLFL